MYVYKYPTRCNNSILVLLQDHSTCFGHSPRPSSGVQQLQLTVTGKRMLRWMVNFVVTSTLIVVHNRAVAHITVVELKLNHNDVTNRPILENP
jgi:hypothetical protein